MFSTSAKQLHHALLNFYFYFFKQNGLTPLMNFIRKKYTELDVFKIILENSKNIDAVDEVRNFMNGDCFLIKCVAESKRMKMIKIELVLQ